MYRLRQYAPVDGIEKVKAVHRQRYYERVARMKANGEYDAFKAKKTKEGMRRYYAMSEKQRQETRRKNLQYQKNWRQKMIDEGTYAAYKDRMNARRREVMAEKKTSHGRGEVESQADSEIRAACRKGTTSPMAMVGRTVGASLPPTVVALGLD